MSDKPRKARLSVTYKGEDVNKKISEFATSFSYTDSASGNSDSIDITLQNIGKEWFNALMPDRGDAITAYIKMYNWKEDGDSKTFKCGKFTIDDISFSGRPLICNIGAVSTPANTGFKATTKTKVWTKATIKEIAEQIAKEAKVKLVYEAETINIAEIEQNNETNSSFLLNLCSSYGLAMKIYSNKIIIYDEAVYEAKKKVATIKESQMLSWSHNTTLEGTYTGVRIAYTNPDTKKTTEIVLGSDERLLEVKSRVDSQNDAELQAAAKVNEANKKITTMSVKIMANPSITAGSVVVISGLGKLNGRYFVDRVVHNLGSGYTMSLSLRLIQERITAKSKKAAEKKKAEGIQVEKGAVPAGKADSDFVNSYYSAAVHETGMKIFRHTISAQ